MKNAIVGTAGHIDHGKSALIEAMTGVHPDRLKEEKERGITIDLGFANLLLHEDLQIGFVDVPGHERFIKNMLAGVGGIDAVILVIAADESVMPQTREHLEICELLKISKGVVVISKVDLVELDLLELVKIEVQAFLKGSFLESAPMICVSARSGSGIGELKECLYTICHQLPPRSLSDSPRLPIDRVFSLRGYGTVVTGTLVSGTLQKDQEIEIYPVGIKGRIRGIQVHASSTNQAVAGQRTAVNLHGVEVHELRRGMELAEPKRYTPVKVFDAEIQVLNSSPVPIRNKMRVRLHHGTSEIIGMIIPLSSKEIKPGDSGFARVALDEEALWIPRDRFIFRRVSPLSTLGGGTVLDIHPPRARRFTSVAQEFLQSIAMQRLDEMVMPLAQRNKNLGLGEAELLSQTLTRKIQVKEILSRLVRERRLVLLSSDPIEVMEVNAFGQLEDEVCQALGRHHQQEPLSLGVSKEQLFSQVFKRSHPDAAGVVIESLLKTKKIQVEQEKVRLYGHQVKLNPVEGSSKDTIERVFREAGWKVPQLDEVLSGLSVPKDQARSLVALLSREKRLVKISESLVFHADAIHQLKEILANYKKTSDRIDVGKFKELIDVSRKYAIPLLEYLDRERITRRAGDVRILL